MRSTLPAAVVLLAAVTLAGCSSDDDSVAEAPVAPSTTAAPSETATPTGSATPSETASATPSESAEPSPSETPTPSPSETVEPTPSATPTPTAAPTRSGAQRGLRSARADARTVSPQLQSYFDEREYPVDLAQLRSTLGDAGVTLAAGNSIGGYGLAGNGVDFVLCVQHQGGGWASWSTEAGRVDDSGATGACPGSASAG